MWKKQALSPQALNPQASGLRGLDFVRAAPPPSQNYPQLPVHTRVTFFALFVDVIFGTHLCPFWAPNTPKMSQNRPQNWSTILSARVSEKHASEFADVLMFSLIFENADVPQT